MSNSTPIQCQTLSEWRKKRDSWARSFEADSLQQLYTWRVEWLKRLETIIHIRDVRTKQDVNDETMLMITSRTNHPSAYATSVQADLLRILQTTMGSGPSFHCLTTGETAIRLHFARLQPDNTFLTGVLEVAFQG